ncbi:MAG: radical SAM protein [Thermoproteota archaeon]
MKKSRLLLRSLVGCRKTAIFSITTRCNCNCSMCGIPKMDKHSISLERAEEVIDDCYRNGVLFISLTGGEPLLHPEIKEIAKYAGMRGMYVHIASNGTMPDRLRQLKGLIDLIGISLDSHIPEEHDKNRGRKKCSEEVTRSIKVCHELGIKTIVNTPPNQMIKNRVEEYVTYVNRELGCPVGFCYPMVDNGGYYGNGSNVVSDLTPQEIVRFYHEVMRLKKNGYKIANTDIFFREAIAYTLGNKVSPCRAGESVVWIDWFGSIHPCFNKKNITLNSMNRDSWESHDASICNECFNQCFREPSLVSGSLRSILADWKLYKYLL